MSEKNWRNDEDFTKYITVRKADGTPVFAGAGVPPEAPLAEPEEFVDIATGELYQAPKDANQNGDEESNRDQD